MEVSYDKPVMLTTNHDKKVQKNNQDCAHKRSLSEHDNTNNTDKLAIELEKIALIENGRDASLKYYSEYKKFISSRKKQDFNKTVSIKKLSADKRLKRPNNTIKESKRHCSSKSSSKDKAVEKIDKAESFDYSYKGIFEKILARLDRIEK
ncbi:25393_t:CDS:2, partial [Dentiscutata erythropus]